MPGRRSFAAVLLGAACFAVSGCSPGADYPSPFPAVHDMPPARGDATLTPVQVQQATDDLITERNRLTAETQTAGAKSGAGPSADASSPGGSQGSGAHGEAAVANGPLVIGAETK